MLDFFIEHRMPVNSMYFGSPGLTKTVVSPVAGPRLLRELWNRGQRWWVLAVGTLSTDNSTTSAACRLLVNQTRQALEVTDAAGWPRSNLIIYIGDEIGGPLLNGVLAQSAAVKAVDPRIQVVTCGRDQWARRIRHLEWPWLPDSDTPLQHFPHVDFFIPYTVGYANTSLPTLKAVRQHGQKIGWYTVRSLYVFDMDQVQSRMCLGFTKAT